MTERRPEGQPLPPDLADQLRSALTPAGQKLLQDLLRGAPPDQVLRQAAKAAGVPDRELRQLLARPEALADLARKIQAGGKVDPALLRRLLEAGGQSPPPPAPGKGTRRNPP
ncbi:MAG: hypothetical protein DIU70_000190 [Bacillota bacterium]|nr:MAG: hypothetical protein DIU70_14205 [Bacillota bacterium]